MENAKMWFGLVKQMIYEIVILFLLYLFVGNNFGDNIFSGNWLKDPSVQDFILTIMGKMFSIDIGPYTVILNIFIGILAIIIGFILICLIIPIAIIFIIFAFSLFWMPIFITFILCLSFKVRLISYTKAFGGQYPSTAFPKICDWYKQSKTAYIIFVILSRIAFVLLLFFKATNAPTTYIADFVLFKWNMCDDLMKVLILSVGAAIALFSTMFSIIRYTPKNLYQYLEQHTCPNCHKIAWIGKVHREKIASATYDSGHEISSGYYTRDVIGEVVDSAGNHVGDVEGDVWVDTSATHYKKLTPDIYELTKYYTPCGCQTKKTETE